MFLQTASGGWTPTLIRDPWVSGYWSTRFAHVPFLSAQQEPARAAITCSTLSHHWRLPCSCVFDTGSRLQDMSQWKTLILAFQTLGVVYGDIGKSCCPAVACPPRAVRIGSLSRLIDALTSRAGTSPLYVFASTPPSQCFSCPPAFLTRFRTLSLTSPALSMAGVFDGYVPVTSDNILGAASLIIWTITAIPVIKYALIVLRADDNGQGALVQHVPSFLPQTCLMPHKHRYMCIQGSSVPVSRQVGHSRCMHSCAVRACPIQTLRGAKMQMPAAGRRTLPTRLESWCVPTVAEAQQSAHWSGV